VEGKSQLGMLFVFTWCVHTYIICMHNVHNTYVCVHHASEITHKTRSFPAEAAQHMHGILIMYSLSSWNHETQAKKHFFVRCVEGRFSHDKRNISTGTRPMLNIGRPWYAQRQLRWDCLNPMAIHLAEHRITLQMCKCFLQALVIIRH
jgi:hypothetical protein